MKLFNHVQIKVNDLKRSSEFYNAIMTILGYPVVLNKSKVVGYGTSLHDMFEIRQSDETYHLSHSVHLAFNASSIDKVNAFYDAALENGGKCNGKPDFRPQYEDRYYAAFILDPDGHNIEVVYCATE